MDFLQIPQDSILQFASQGLDFLPVFRERFTPLFFPDQDAVPDLTWDELVTGFHLKNIPSQNRDIRVNLINKLTKDNNHI